MRNADGIAAPQRQPGAPVAVDRLGNVVNPNTLPSAVGHGRSTVGPIIVSDIYLHETMNHFDHERIPERVVHARGAGAFGEFQLTKSLSGISKAAILTEVGTTVSGVLCASVTLMAEADPVTPFVTSAVSALSSTRNKATGT